MKILVLATDYPNNEGHVTLMYIHSRCQYYISHGIDVTVLNFSAKNNYTFQGIPVITLAQYKQENSSYDLLVSHAPNIRQHFVFLIKYMKRFKRVVFFFHGHEVLRVQETYSQPYPYMQSASKIKMQVQNIYDTFKLHIWHFFFDKYRQKITMVFVSNWMKEKFRKYIKLDPDSFDTHVISNNIGMVFERNNYDLSSPKPYDFITIRSNLDGSKYAIDFVNNLAKFNPNLKFLVIGRGKFFQYNDKAKNLTWLDKNLNHDDMPNYLNQAKCALMPTRLDAQGVMTCEMASFGIPVITSNIDICQELALHFKNLILIDNDKNIDLSKYISNITKMYQLPKNTDYFQENTVIKETTLIRKICHEN